MKNNELNFIRWNEFNFHQVKQLEKAIKLGFSRIYIMRLANSNFSSSYMKALIKTLKHIKDTNIIDMIFTYLPDRNQLLEIERAIKRGVPKSIIKKMIFQNLNTLEIYKLRTEWEYGTHDKRRYITRNS